MDGRRRRRDKGEVAGREESETHEGHGDEEERALERGGEKGGPEGGEK